MAFTHEPTSFHKRECLNSMPTISIKFAFSLIRLTVYSNKVLQYNETVNQLLNSRHNLTEFNMQRELIEKRSFKG